MLGTIYMWSGINSIYASYLKINDSPNIKLTDAYFLMPIISCLSNVAMMPGSVLERYIGPRM
jgi:hypothetical protein